MYNIASKKNLYNILILWNILHLGYKISWVSDHIFLSIFALKVDRSLFVYSSDYKLNRMYEFYATIYLILSLYSTDLYLTFSFLFFRWILQWKYIALLHMASLLFGIIPEHQFSDRLCITKFSPRFGPKLQLNWFYSDRSVYVFSLFILFQNTFNWTQLESGKHLFGLVTKFW